MQTTNQTLELSSVRADINNFLDIYYLSQIERAQELHDDYAQLWQTMYAVHEAGGKRIRPYMMLLAYTAFGGEDLKAVLPTAAALELLHSCMLMHDDIIDRDYIRHGRPNVAGTYRQQYQARTDIDTATHLADSAALLAGDSILSAAYQVVMDSPLPDNQKIRAAKRLGDITFVVAGGELLDTGTVLLPFNKADPLGVAQLKTADYSFVGPLTMGAELAGADEESQQTLREFGTALGIAFQLTDDLIGLFGDPEQVGKPAVSDLQEAKRTFLMREAYARASDDQKKRLDAILGKATITDKELKEVQNILVTCGAKQATEETAHIYSEQARSKVPMLAIEVGPRVQFEELIAMAVKRSK